MKNSGIKLSDLPLKLRAQVTGAIATRAAFGAPKLRQDTKGPNKTEAAFELYLSNYYPDADIKREGVTLKLGNGVRYTPDFFVRQKSGLIQIYETKGFMRDDAAVKIKVAASAFPFWNFFLVRAHDRRLAGWNVQAIMP